LGISGARGEIVFALIGHLRADDLVEVSALFAQEAAGRAFALNLKDLILVDREAIHFLGECEARGIPLRDCPGYVRAWIACARSLPKV
jgi:hypothetical protein